MNRFLIFGIISLMLISCTGSGSSDSNNTASRQPKRAHELRFLRDIGINPDSMLIDDRWVMPNEEDWETVHNRWLDMDRIYALALDQLCEADTSNSPIALISVWPVDEHYTMLILHQYLGDSAPIHLVTYDGDGIAMDHLDLGVCSGINLRYWDEDQSVPGVETSYLTFSDRIITVERELKLATRKQQPIWAVQNTDSYEIDKRGYILHRNASSQLNEMDDNMRSQRLLEATDWYSIQDEQAMDAISACFDSNPNVSDSMGMTLFLRLYKSPWTTAHWLYTHQDSPLIPILAKEMKEMDNEVVNKVLEAVHDEKQKSFLKALYKH